MDMLLLLFFSLSLYSPPVPSHFHCSDSITPSFYQVRLASSVLEHSQNSVLKHTSSPWSSLSSGRQDPGIISQTLLGLALAPVQLSTHSKTHPVYPTAVQLFICIPSLDYSIISVSQNITPPSKPGYDDIFPTKLLQLAQASTNLFEFEQQIICAFSIIPVLPYFVF